MISPGLCSVRLRHLAPERVIELTAEAGLEVIEWGADVHVPPGDTALAAEVAAATTGAGLSVCSYGSYFRSDPAEPLTPILDSAQALGADRVRVWAGTDCRATLRADSHRASTNSVAPRARRRPRLSRRGPR